VNDDFFRRRLADDFFRRWLAELETQENQGNKMSYDDVHYDNAGRRTPMKVVPSTAMAIPEGVTIHPANSRAGHRERDIAASHITQAVEGGYITPEEGLTRKMHVEEAEKISDLRTLTSDLPAPIDTRPWYQTYDWDNQRHWLPTLIAGLAASAVTAVIPTSVLSAEHLFPGNPLGFGIGILTLIIGIVGFFACLTGIITKTRP
jgi:hypothetical protein